MTKPVLSQFFTLNRRYSRSINLERDFEVLDTVAGYILTERATNALQRIFSAIARTESTRAWTLTGVYGTGKSAFAHYLVSLCGPANSSMCQSALGIAQKTFGSSSPDYQMLETVCPPQGLFRAVAVGQREPLRYTLVRALERGLDVFWPKGRKPAIARQITDWAAEVEVDRASFSSRQVLAAIKEIAEAAKTDVLLIIDELGKNLEFAAHNPGADDLYLLQQLAELSRKNKFQVYVIGLLHQAFAEYSQRLAAAEKNEWAKIQGRFEDIPFTESIEQMTRLIGQAIDASKASHYQPTLNRQAKEWSHILKSATDLPEISASILAAAYPLHPIAALALPMLCTRYAQNDRSLFTFLTSSEPHSFANFLKEMAVEDGKIPTLKLHRIYDYFVESVGSGIGSRPNLQRWIEIQGLITDAKYLDIDSLTALKTIGILNLITSTGAFRATRTLVKLALTDELGSPSRERDWETIIDSLLDKGLLTYRKQLDELRIWEGSDFDVEQAITAYVEKERSPLSEILTKLSPLKPLIAQRHSYHTGTLRYFERQYIETQAALNALQCSVADCDGLVGYWLNSELPAQVPAQTTDGKPLILLTASNLTVLRVRALELAALRKIQTSATQLQTDGVARREVRHRLVQAKRLLDEALNQTFNLAEDSTTCWVQGQQEAISHTTGFNAQLSEVCDRVYSETPILWNELINRRELTSQGAKARRELIEALLESSGQERLGLQGYGPEVAMYYSVLGETGMHRPGDEGWGLYPPDKTSGVWSVWQAIAKFCQSAKDKPCSLEVLYQYLEAPPYGVKRGVIPVLLAAVLLYDLDNVSVYKDGTFIPVLGSEHFELLVKDPARFAVKYIEVAGLRSQVFRELEAILRTSPAKGHIGSRNLTVLSVVKPLVNFVRKLPAYTLKTKRISLEAQAVIQTLLQTQEPDTLLFTALPKACGLQPILVGSSDDGATARIFRETLAQFLREIHTAYEMLLTDAELLLYTAFGLRSSRDQLRQDLQFRARYLFGNCAESSLDRFVRAAVNETAEHRIWLEALLMIVADKPAEVWEDKDFTMFEVKLGDLARRFKNLEALQKEVAASSKGGFEARRITMTRPDGEEIHQMVWMDHEQQAKVNPLIEKILAECSDRATSPQEARQLQQALLTCLTERVLGEESLSPTPRPSAARPTKAKATRHLP